MPPVHLRLPLNVNGSFIICTECCSFGTNEENELSRHIKIHHRQSRLRLGNAVVYNYLLRVPRDVAMLLMGDANVKGQEKRSSFTGTNNNPKSRVATAAEIVRMCQIRGVAAPAAYAGVAAATQWPPA